MQELNSRRNDARNYVTELAIIPRPLSRGLYVARTIVPHRCADIPVRILNPTGVERKLYKGTSLADLEPVEIMDARAVQEDNRSVQGDSNWQEDLLENMDPSVTIDEKRQVGAILEEYADCFSRSEYDLGHTTLVKHSINTGDNAPVKQTLRRQPLAYLPEIDRQLEEMSRQKIIEPSQSPWASNLVVAKKKDGTLRLCVDYRNLNNLTRKDSYPLPRIADCLDALGSAIYFSTFDLRSGYFQIAMEESDKDKTTFVTRRGTFRYASMPFGLCNAPSTFQRLMDVVMTGLNYEICLVYLDDIVLFSQTVDEHLVRLRQLLERLRRANLKLKPSKCHLLRKSVTFLGHVVSAEGIATDPDKVATVRDCPVPTSVTEVRQFTGLCNYYRRFLKNFARVAAPLHPLTGKSAKFVWTPACEIAFNELKRSLITSPVLAMPVDNGEYRLDTDASDHAIGAVLSQIQFGEERVIAYASVLRPNRNAIIA